MKNLIIIMLFFLTFGNLAFAESYLCTEKMVTGFVFQENTKTWEQANLKGSKFLLKPLKPEDKSGEEEMGVYEVKGGTLLFGCEYWFEELGVAHCGNKNDYHFKFQREKNRTGRFIAVNLGLSYLSGENDLVEKLMGGREQPSIGIGTCVRVD